MTTLNLSSSNLTELNGLPANLQILYCSGNQLSELNGLPANLQILYCGNNQLTKLNYLPVDLLELYCRHNQLTELKDLPDNLQKLDCNGNQLKVLVLPKSLKHLTYNGTVTIFECEEQINKFNEDFRKKNNIINDCDLKEKNKKLKEESELLKKQID